VGLTLPKGKAIRTLKLAIDLVEIVVRFARIVVGSYYQRFAQWVINPFTFIDITFYSIVVFSASDTYKYANEVLFKHRKFKEIKHTRNFRSKDYMLCLVLIPLIASYTSL